MEKNCKYCGAVLKDGDKFCENCGAKVELAEAAYKEQTFQNTQNIQSNNVQTNDVDGTVKTNPSAIAGFVCSLVGLVVFGIIMGVIAICLSITAKKHIKSFKNEKGNGLATAALIIGIIDIAFTLIGSVITAIL